MKKGLSKDSPFLFKQFERNYKESVLPPSTGKLIPLM